jgi:hypothetical protein
MIDETVLDWSGILFGLRLVGHPSHVLLYRTHCSYSYPSRAAEDERFAGKDEIGR